MEQSTTIGLDLAKNVFQVHGVDAACKVLVRSQLRRGDALPASNLDGVACHMRRNEMSVIPLDHARVQDGVDLPKSPGTVPLLARDGAKGLHWSKDARSRRAERACHRFRYNTG